MNCSRCKHFSDKNTYGPPVAWGICGRGDGADGEASDQSTLAYACDAERYSASLVVSPEFGCVQFEECDLPDKVARFANWRERAMRHLFSEEPPQTPS